MNHLLDGLTKLIYDFLLLLRAERTPDALDG